MPNKDVWLDLCCWSSYMYEKENMLHIMVVRLHQRWEIFEKRWEKAKKSYEVLPRLPDNISLKALMGCTVLDYGECTNGWLFITPKLCFCFPLPGMYNVLFSLCGSWVSWFLITELNAVTLVSPTARSFNWTRILTLMPHVTRKWTNEVDLPCSIVK